MEWHNWSGSVNAQPQTIVKPRDEAELRAHVRERLAGYKTPKRIILGTIPFRAPNGKADYKSVTAFARQELGMA